MRRTEQLQGLRLMKFEEVYGRSFRGELSQLEAAEILGMSERTFRHEQSHRNAHVPTTETRAKTALPDLELFPGSKS